MANSEDLAALRGELQGQFTTAVAVLLLCVVMMVTILIGCFIYVDCSHVAESLTVFLSEYNSQYIHDDHHHERDQHGNQCHGGKENDETKTQDSRMKKKNS
jgi:hypothetical protein